MSVPMISLGEVSNTVMGQAPPGAECNKEGKGTAFVKAGEFSFREPIIREWTTKPLKLARKGDVLVCVVGATAGKINLGLDCAIGRSVAAVRPQGTRLDTDYLHHFLQTKTKHLRTQSQGLAQGVITREMLASLEILLPPLPDQRRIAAILDKADALRRKRKRAIELLDSLTQSIFTAMFVEVSAEWTQRSVDELSVGIRTGPFGSQLLHSEFVAEGIPVLGIDNAVSNEFRWQERRYITPEKYKKLSRYTVRPKDVLITIMGTCGRCAIVPEDIPLAINTKHLCCITLDAGRCLPEFLQAVFLQHPAVLKQLGVQAKGAVMPGLNMGIIKSLQIPVPPMALQQRFAEAIHSVRAQRTIYESSAGHAAALFATLQHRAFSGQL